MYYAEDNSLQQRPHSTLYTQFIKSACVKIYAIRQTINRNKLVYNKQKIPALNLVQGFRTHRNLYLT